MVTVMNYDLRHGDSRDVLKTLADNSIDSVVTDPPYALVSIVKRFGSPTSAPPTDGDVYSRASAGFMGQTWDTGETAFAVEFWSEVYRVLKPGGHVIASSGTRTYHRLACAIEDAGFEIRDMIPWLYGSGFPKSHSVQRAIAERPECQFGDGRWDGWGTALKPAHEPWAMARKSLIGTVVENVLAHGVGALNIDDCRIAGAKPDTTRGAGGQNGVFSPLGPQGRIEDDGRGRWPANVVHDGSEPVLAGFPESTTVGHAPRNDGGKGALFKAANGTGGLGERRDQDERHFDTGSSARFFYCAKASQEDRNEGAEAVRTVTATGEEKAGNIHPTVKPTDLMRWLIRMVTPPGGLVLDPFMGSGSTGKAAMLEGVRFLGIEREAGFMAIAQARVAHAALRRQVSPPQVDMFSGA